MPAALQTKTAIRLPQPGNANSFKFFVAAAASNLVRSHRSFSLLLCASYPTAPLDNYIISIYSIQSNNVCSPAVVRLDPGRDLHCTHTTTITMRIRYQFAGESTISHYNYYNYCCYYYYYYYYYNYRPFIISFISSFRALYLSLRSPVQAQQIMKLTAMSQFRHLPLPHCLRCLHRATSTQYILNHPSTIPTQ